MSKDSPREHWDYLISSDKSPTPKFEQLLLSIATYIVRLPCFLRRALLTKITQNKQVAPWDVDHLTPAKLASFYRLVGGNYDSLFLESPHKSLGFIYQSLGCFHSLQPGKDPFAAPSVPSLTPQGFVRWQTVQLLLGPEEHVPYLQAAVKRFDLLNAKDKVPFPKSLPADALPRRPDPDMIKWHESVGEKLRRECEPHPTSPPNSAKDRKSRPSDLDSLTSASSMSTEDQSVSDAAADYFSATSPRTAASYPHANVVPVSPINTRHKFRGWDSEIPKSPYVHRKTTSADSKQLDDGWDRDGPTPTYEHPFPRKAQPHRHARAPSIVSSASSSSSGRSRSPSAPATKQHDRRYSHGHVHTHHNKSKSQSHSPDRPARSPIRSPVPTTDAYGRRHSAHVVYDERKYVSPQPTPTARGQSSLSPPFYASSSGFNRPVSQVGPLPPPGTFQPMNPILANTSAPIPQRQFATSQMRPTMVPGTYRHVTAGGGGYENRNGPLSGGGTEAGPPPPMRYADDDAYYKSSKTRKNADLVDDRDYERDRERARDRDRDRERDKRKSSRRRAASYDRR